LGSSESNSEWDSTRCRRISRSIGTPYYGTAVISSDGSSVGRNPGVVISEVTTGRTRRVSVRGRGSESWCFSISDSESSGSSADLSA